MPQRVLLNGDIELTSDSAFPHRDPFVIPSGTAEKVRDQIIRDFFNEPPNWAGWRRSLTVIHPDTEDSILRLFHRISNPIFIANLDALAGGFTNDYKPLAVVWQRLMVSPPESHPIAQLQDLAEKHGLPSDFIAWLAPKPTPTDLGQEWHGPDGTWTAGYGPGDTLEWQEP